MVELPVETREPDSHPSPQPPFAGVPYAGPRLAPLAAALLAIVMAVATVAAIAAIVVVPDVLPLTAPLVAIAGAVALWSIAKISQIRLKADVERLAHENAQLVHSVEWLADTARELRLSEAALNEARQKAEAANQAKSRLLATVSHEFRTPLNGILGLTGLLLETEQTPDQQTYARAVHSSGEALLALVDDMLDFSKIEAGRLDLRPEPTDPAVLLQEIAELLAARAHGKGIDIAADVAPDVPPVMVDAHRLRQVLLNLAGNGVKFTERGGVALTARRLAHLDDHVEIAFSVKDTGPGIPPEATVRLFREFEQLEQSPARRHGGAGLGLAISRRIVRAMGGEIDVGPNPAGGTVFSFRLALPIASARAPEVLPNLGGLSVLIAAPDGAEPRVMATELRRLGAEARVATTTYEASALVGAAAAAGQAYDAVLLYAPTPSEGTAALARIRDAAGSRVPAAVMIDPGQRGEVEALRRAGFDAYLVRPVRRTSLARIVADSVVSLGTFAVDPGDLAPRRQASARHTGSGLNVLLAEDNEINALLARAVLEGLGHTVDEVRDGAASVAAATTAPGKYGLVLMDLHMPGLDGIAAVSAIRAHERETGAPRARILAVTADVLAETRAAAIAAGVDQVLEKPITPDALRRALAVVADAA